MNGHGAEVVPVEFEKKPGRVERRFRGGVVDRGQPDSLHGLPVIRQNVAGIDLGSQPHRVRAPNADGPAAKSLISGR
jgi:hypothetical protein